MIWYPAQSRAAASTAEAGGMAVYADASPARNGPYPLVIWSPGTGATAAPSAPFLAYLASHGFVVAGLTPHDCTPPCTSAQFDDNAAKRADDVIAVLNGISALSAADDPLLKNNIDGNRVGVAGLSFGGYTALLAIQRDQRFRAAISMAPPASWFDHPSEISKPVMLIQGEWDAVVSFWTTSAFYGELPASIDRWFVGIPHATHALTIDRCIPAFSLVPCWQTLPPTRVNTIIARWGTTFLLRYVARESQYAASLTPASDPEYFVVVTKAGARPSPIPTATDLFPS